MNRTLLASGLRYLARHRVQSLLLVVSIALGVAMIVAIDVANRSASRAFELSTESLAGRATHQIFGGPSGLDEGLYRHLRVDLGLRDTAPVVDGYVTAVELDRQPLHLLGVDPFAEAPFRNYLASGDSGVPVDTLTAFLTQPGAVLLSDDVAGRYRLKVGDSLTLRWNTTDRRVRLVGLLHANDDVSRRALQGLILADIATGQELLGMTGRLSHIDVIADPSTPAGQAALTEIQAALPPGARLERPETRTQTVEEMTQAFELNLTALSLLALIVGMFLIYNTMTFSVVQRRAIIGTLRALGVTRRQIFSLVLSEAAVLGIFGTLLGLGLGLVLGRGMVRLVTQTINDLYFTVSVREVAVEPLTFVKGGVLGVIAALVGAAAPALEATSIPPQGALRRSEVESRVRRVLPWVTAGGLFLGLLGIGVLALPTRRVDVSFTGLFLILIGMALLAPALTVVLMAVLNPVGGRSLGVLGRMAPRSIIRSLSRTSVAIAALMVTVSVIVGISIMIGSFRQTVEDWLSTTLQADIFISPPGVSASRAASGLDPALKSEVAALPGIARVETARELTIDSPDYGSVNLVVVSADISGQHRRFAWAEGDASQVWTAMRNGAVIVSESFAYRHGLPYGPSAVRLQTDRGVQSFPVVGIHYDYASDQGVILMDDAVYRRSWDDRGYTSLAVYVAPGVDVDAEVRALQAHFAARNQKGGDPLLLAIQSNAGLRQSAMQTFDQAFAITTALRLLAMLVAFIGVLSTVMSLQLERTRELGVLRATGMTLGQLGSMTLIETGLMGGTAGVLALPTGLVLAIVLIYVINRRSFGWTLQMLLQPEYFAEALAIAIVAALLAGLYPALRLRGLVTAEAIRTE